MQYFSLSQWEDCWFLIEQEKKQGKILDIAMIHNFQKKNLFFFLFLCYFIVNLMKCFCSRIHRKRRCWLPGIIRNETLNRCERFWIFVDTFKVFLFFLFLFFFFANLVRKNACQVCLFRKRMLPRNHIWNWNRKYRVFFVVML